MNQLVPKNREKKGKNSFKENYNKYINIRIFFTIKSYLLIITI
jgi:hypothetical protein